jgi:acetyltransferase-like isoleucine patch superfamily enzyme
MQPPTAGADAVLPARRTALASLGARLRLLRQRGRARGRLDAGPGVWLSPGARVEVASGATVTLGAGCELGPGARIEAAAGTVVLGDGVRMGERATLVAISAVTVGAEATLGDWSLVTDSDPELGEVERPARVQAPHAAAVTIGAGARIAAHATVLAGARVGDGALVGSYALVRDAVPPRAVATGVPARPA